VEAACDDPGALLLPHLILPLLRERLEASAGIKVNPATEQEEEAGSSKVTIPSVCLIWMYICVVFCFSTAQRSKSVHAYVLMKHIVISKAFALDVTVAACWFVSCPQCAASLVVNGDAAANVTVAAGVIIHVAHAVDSKYLHCRMTNLLFLYLAVRADGSQLLLSLSNNTQSLSRVLSHQETKV